MQNLREPSSAHGDPDGIRIPVQHGFRNLDVSDDPVDPFFGMEKPRIGTRQQADVPCLDREFRAVLHGGSADASRENLQAMRSVGQGVGGNEPESLIGPTVRRSVPRLEAAVDEYPDSGSVQFKTGWREDEG